MKEKFYITTPIYYVNAKPHIGHAYTTIAADVLARFHRGEGRDVFYLTGTDEHGAKIAEAATEQGIKPQELCDQNSKEFKKIWKKLDIAHDGFIRTTDEEHMKIVQKFLQKLYDKKFIYKGKYQGLYCVGCEAYKKEEDLVNGLCPDHKTKPKKLSEEVYFFKLSSFRKKLEEIIESEEFKVVPKERKNEVLGFLRGGLEDVAISRSKISWGVPLPFNKNQVAYVWIDALLNYITALGWPAGNKFKKFWPADVQLIGKDILRFHAVIWPAILLACDVELPKLLFVHGYFTVNGQKMSKTLGNVIDPRMLSKEYGVDAVRYLLLSAFPFGADGDVSVKRFKENYNSDLANGLGNLVSRIIALYAKLDNSTGKKTSDTKLVQKTRETLKGYREALRKLALEKVLALTWNFISFCDNYIEEKKPWEKDVGSPEYKEIVSGLVRALSVIQQLVDPFMPETGAKIRKQLETRKRESLFPRLE